MPEQKRSLKWRTRLLMLLIAFSVVPLGGFAVWVSGMLETTFSDATLESLQALASAKAEAIDQFTDYRRSDVERIATLIAPYLTTLHEAEAVGGAETAPPGVETLPKLPDARTIDSEGGQPPGDPTPPAAPEGAATVPAAPPGPAAPAASDEEQQAVERARTALQQPLGLILWDQKEFEELLVIDPTGRVVASTFQDHVGLSAADIEYFEQGRKATFVQPVFLSPITEQLTMVIATPIRDKDRRDIGVLAARLNLDRFFRLIGDRTGLGRTGETVVGRMVGSKLVLMAPTRHDPDAALKGTIPIGSPRARGLQEAAREQSGSGETPDYRGVRTLAAWQYVPSLEWGLLVKIDYREAMIGVTRARRAMLYLLVGILVLAAIASFVVSRAFIRPLQALKEATDRISRGDLNVQLAIRSQDEIGQLADSFERMVASIKYYRERSARYAQADDSQDDTSAEGDTEGEGEGEGETKTTPSDT